MNWLARLKSEKAPGVHATKPTKLLQWGDETGFVGFVASPSAHYQKIEAIKALASDPPPADPDGDREAFEERAAIMEFDGGLSRAEAEALAGYSKKSEVAPLKVANVAAESSAKPATDDAQAKANDTHDPDRLCWPHSSAMNGQEISTFTGRLSWVTRKGMCLEDAESLADRLVIRDREGDDRRACLECAYFEGFAGCRCLNCSAAKVPSTQLADDFVVQLRRCPGFAQQSLKPTAGWVREPNPMRI